MAPTLIYCASRNKAFDDIALQVGYKLGAQLPTTVYHSIYFADQDWKKPDRTAYMRALAIHRPHMATVLDWERDDQFEEVMDWAEEAAQSVEQVLIIPKVIGATDRIPRSINGKGIVLAYSVPTQYGGSQVPLWEFAGRSVHLLGGSPHTQMQCYMQFGAIADVVSVDGNMANKMATNRCHFWCNGTARYAKDRYWPKLDEAGWYGGNAPQEAFRRSCINIMKAWQSL